MSQDLFWEGCAYPQLLNLDQFLQCPICKDTFDGPVTSLVCFHTYCSFCIRSCLNEGRCPACHVEMYESSLVRNPALEDVCVWWSENAALLCGVLSLDKLKDEPKDKESQEEDQEKQEEHSEQNEQNEQNEHLEKTPNPHQTKAKNMLDAIISDNESGEIIVNRQKLRKHMERLKTVKAWKKEEVKDMEKKISQEPKITNFLRKKTDSNEVVVLSDDEMAEPVRERSLEDIEHELNERKRQIKELDQFLEERSSDGSRSESVSRQESQDGESEAGDEQNAPEKMGRSNLISVYSHDRSDEEYEVISDSESDVSAPPKKEGWWRTPKSQNQEESRKQNPLPKLNFSMMTMPKIKEKFKLYKIPLPTQASKTHYTAYYNHYQTLYNANLDKKNKLLRSALVEKLKEWERLQIANSYNSRVRQQRLPDTNEYNDNINYIKEHQDHFQSLEEKARGGKRRKMEQIREIRENREDSQFEKIQEDAESSEEVVEL